MAERRMEPLRWIWPYTIRGFNVQDNTYTLTNHRYFVKCFPHNEERNAGATFKVPRWVDLSLPWKWRIYGHAPYAGVSVVVGISITTCPMGFNQGSPAAPYTKMTIPSRGATNIWGGDTADVAPYLKAKASTPGQVWGGTSALGDQVLFNIKRFSFDASDNLNDTWAFLGCSIFCPVRDKYDTLDWVGI